MTLGRRYLAGLAVAAAVGVAVVAFLPAGLRPAVTVAVVLGFIVQAPLGWMLLRVYGKPVFLQVWGLGMGIRGVSVGVLAIAGKVAGIRSLEALLVGLVATLFCLVLVEAGVLVTGEAE